ncbi:MAG TPA: LCP family protein [Acidimicrobiales bacterium]|nr:LCP family protein [Acidimicrobiales bacterium]
MSNGRPTADAPVGARPRTKRPVSNEDGLRSLGERMQESVAPPKPAATEALRGDTDTRTDSTRSGGRHLRKRATGRRKRRRGVKVLLVLLAVVVVLLGAAAGYLGYLNSLVHRVRVLGLSTDATSGALVGTQNILLVGSTSRCVLKQQSIAYGLCSQGVTGVNSDIVMVLHLDSNDQRVSILSIPRDLFVPNARNSGADKIDAALADGPTQLVAAVEDDFGIPIQHYVELNFDSFASVVDALGGVDMYFPEPVFDDYSGLYVTTPGCIHLDGVRALQVVRARHLQYQPPGVTTSDRYDWPQEAQSDLARIRRTHEFLRVLASAVAKQGLGNPLTDRQLIAGVAPNLTVDSGFSTTDMVNMVLGFHAVNIGTAPQLTVPVLESSSSSYSYQGYDYGNIEFPTEPQDQQAIDQVLGVNADTDTMTGKPLPKPGSITVSVLNGTGLPDQAADTASALEALDFATIGVGDAASVGPVSETVVDYSSSSDEAAAERVARSLSGSVILSRGPTTDGAQVTVITGTNFSVAAPAGSSGSSAAGGSSSSTNSASPGSAAYSDSSATASDAFSAPTPATSGLQPWDPRSCTASGGEGP